MADKLTTDAAERQISAILCQLEIATGSVVEAVQIVDVDVTTVADEHRVIDRRAQIELKRLPETRWAL